MSFGQFLGAVGNAAGMGPAASIAGYGLDAFTDYNARQDDRAMRGIVPETSRRNGVQ